MAKGERATESHPRPDRRDSSGPAAAVARPGAGPRRAGRRNRGARRRALARAGVLSLAALSAAWSAGCRYDNTTFDPRALDEQERIHAEVIRPRKGPLPTTLEATPKARRDATTLPATLPTTGQAIRADEGRRLSLREILLRSVANSAEVRVAGYDPAINAQRVIEAEARFDPRLFTNVTFQRTDSATAGSSIPDPNNVFSSIPLVSERSDTQTIEAGIRQLLPTGGEARLSYQVQNNYFEPERFRRNPFWESTLRLEVTQPLLREFGSEINAARIRIARNDQRISVLDFRRVLEENLTELERDYWQLYQAESEVRIQEDLLLQTIQTYTTLAERQVMGMEASLIPVRQAEGQVHARKAALIDAKRRVRDLSDDIKRRMNDPEFPVSGPDVILTSTPPLVLPVNFDTQEQIDSALQHRLELGQQQLRIDSASVAQQVAKRSLLPRLDLVYSIGFNGIDGSLTTSIEDQADFNNLSGSFGVQFEYPLGNREARSVYRRSQLQRLQAIEQYRNIIGQVALDVVLALNDIDSQFAQIAARQQARLATADQLRLIQRQEDVGGRPLTPEFVNVKLQAQSDLAIARREEAAAIAAYNTAIQRLERAKGTLLRYNNILLQEDREMPVAR